MAFLERLTIAAFAAVLTLDKAYEANACRCLYVSVCDGFESSDLVVKAKAISKSEPVEIYGDVTYTVDTRKLFKGEPNAKYAKEISFVTNGSTASCGVVLELGTQYLLGLSYNSDGIFTASSCGLVRQWKSVADEDKVALRAGCEEEDQCDGRCGEFQECLLYSDGTLGNEYYCADACDPSPCDDGEVCTLEQLVQCVRAPCPPSSVCTSSKD